MSVSSKARILVVDDDSELRSIMQKILELEGYVIRQAADGNEAKALIDAEMPDIVITDIFMPEQDGIGLLNAVRRDYPDLPVIVISGSQVGDSSTFLEFAHRLGATSLLPKPFLPQQLLDTVAAVVVRSCSQQSI